MQSHGISRGGITHLLKQKPGQKLEQGTRNEFIGGGIVKFSKAQGKFGGSSHLASTK